MKEETVLQIASRMHDFSDPVDVSQIPYEECDGFYSVWKITDARGSYLLKRTASETELAIYRKLRNRIDALPTFYGATEYRGNPYLLLEFVEGHNLMQATRDDLRRVLDAIIRMQDMFWESRQRIGEPFSAALQSCLNRKVYLKETVLIDAFTRFEAMYRTLPRTLCHNDFLPFNVIVGTERTAFIDWEYGGILPYPAMLARLLAHASEHGETPFFMTQQDRDFAIETYYDRLIHKKGISRADYLAAMNAFLFYESLEWVYVYRKYNKPPDALYDFALRQSHDIAEKL
ncbi:MAG: aminoglycoside phosphotransferase family protein [Clostridia bacterium]|nr:aminoglycoside phosphotransferase family protein [Clostridia bacterium]